MWKRPTSASLYRGVRARTLALAALYFTVAFPEPLTAPDILTDPLDTPVKAVTTFSFPSFV